MEGIARRHRQMYGLPGDERQATEGCYKLVLPLSNSYSCLSNNKVPETSTKVQTSANDTTEDMDLDDTGFEVMDYGNSPCLLVVRSVILNRVIDEYNHHDNEAPSESEFQDISTTAMGNSVNDYLARKLSSTLNQKVVFLCH